MSFKISHVKAHLKIKNDLEIIYIIGSKLFQKENAFNGKIAGDGIESNDSNKEKRKISFIVVCTMS